MKSKCWITGLIAGVLLIQLWGCAGNRYQQRVGVVKEQVSSFYQHLESRQTDQAIFANQRIEQVALESQEYLLRRVGQMSQAERAQEWKVIKIAKETAAENWLALAQYFMGIRDYKRARGTYKRLIEVYKDSAFQSYVNRAETGLRDLDLALPPE